MDNEKVKMSKCCTCGYEWRTGMHGSHSCVMELKAVMDKAIELGLEGGGVDGAHHKMWVIDEMLRILAGDMYEEKVRAHNWDCGIAP